MANKMLSITPEIFAGYLKTNSLPAEITEFLASVDTRHREADKAELEKYLEAYLAKVNKTSATRSKEKNRTIFERGWAEHLEQAKKCCDMHALQPKYFRDTLPCFLGTEAMYVCENASLPFDMQVLYVRYLALTVLKNFKNIHEFGSGSGLNLLTIAALFPEKRLTGYEWTRSGVELANLIGEKNKYLIRGRHFDMLHPDYSVELTEAAVLTYASIEQLGEKYGAFLDFLLRKKPGICVHVEPDTTAVSARNVYHHLAVLYMRLRGYPLQFTQRLNDLQAQGKICILFSLHLPWISAFGNYRCTVWKPC